MNRIIKYKINYIVLILLILVNVFGSTSFASININKADLYSKGDCGQLLKKDGVLVKTNFVVYNNNGVEYPAYCLDKTKAGVGEGLEYSVTTDELLSNVLVWRAITNGYPYKTPSELGCNNEKEAFVATKMAVYSMLYGYTIENFSSVNEAGDRTIKALDKIINTARNSSEIKITSDLIITEEQSEWKVDNIDSKYISKTFKVTANGGMQKYTIGINGEVSEDILVTDKENKKKQEFEYNEKFKILIPITQLGNGGNFTIEAKGKVSTKPILIGRAQNSNNQDYAITGGIYEEGDGILKVSYNKNETKIKILKQDAQTRIPLQGAKFDLLDENKNLINTNIISDSDGQIILKDIMPGTYYLKETKAPGEYNLYDEYIKLEIAFNEEISVIVNNSKKEETEVEVEKKKSEIEVTPKKLEKAKLPKTGM